MVAYCLLSKGSLSDQYWQKSVSIKYRLRKQFDNRPIQHIRTSRFPARADGVPDDELCG